MSTPKDAATERPWRAVEEYEDGPLTFVTDMNRHPVADCEGEANAALIVEAVNSHDSLLARNAELERRVVALEQVISEEMYPENCTDDANRMLLESAIDSHDRRIKSRAAIGKART